MAGGAGQGGRRRVAAAVVAVAAVAAVVTTAPAPQASAQAPPGPLVPARATGDAPLFDGDPTTTERLVEDDPVHAALAVARARFDGRRPTHAVLSRDDVFADSLVGSALTGDGPLLVTPTEALHPDVAALLGELLPRGGDVLLLGGPAALSPDVEASVRRLGLRPRRLAGATRVETALAIADEVRRRHPDRDEVMVARGWGPGTAAWADAVAAGGLAAAAGVPILVTHTEQLDAPVGAWLDADRPARSLVLGGPVALSPAVEAAVPNAERIAGAERTATAAAIAERGWGAVGEGPRRTVVMDATEADAWAVGVAAAGLSADAGAPILTVTRDVLPETRALLATCGTPEVDTLVVGTGRFVSGSLRERIDAVDGETCRGRVRRDAGLTRAPGCPELLASLQEVALERVGPYGLDPWWAVGPVELVDAPVAEEEAFDDADAGADGGTADAPAPSAPARDGAQEDVTGTNVQEAGVDEPDVLKTDGDVALALANGVLRVVDLRGDVPRLADTVTFAEGFPVELVLHDGRAVVFVDGGATTLDGPAPRGDLDAAFFGRWAPRLDVVLLDVTDVDDVTVLETLTLDARYQAARLVDGVLRLVVAHEPAALPFVLPATGSRAAAQAALAHNRDVVEGSTIEDWLTTATRRDARGEVVDEGPLVTCERVSLPPWFSGLGTTDVVQLDVSQGLAPTSAAAVQASAATVYASLDRLVIGTTRWPDHQADTVDAAVTTELHSLDVAAADRVEHVASGRVEGTLLSRWSLSQHDGFLRVATTLRPDWLGGDRDATSSQVVVLAELGDDLVPVGRVTGLGPTEEIRGVRFVGDTGFVVTFRQVDPLYVLDLSRPTAPRAVGELKVTGYSAYLHPLDADRLLGVGQEATPDGRLTGPAVSLFDVSDPAAPRLADREEPGVLGSFLAEHDPRAFLRLAGVEQVVLPIQAWQDDGFGAEGGGDRSGALVYATGAASLSPRGLVQHPAVDGWRAVVQRAFVVDGVLHTVSQQGMATFDLDTLERTSWTPFGDVRRLSR